MVVLKPTDWLEWIDTSVCWAQSSAAHNYHERHRGLGLIIGLRCKENVDLLGQALSTETTLKAEMRPCGMSCAITFVFNKLFAVRQNHADRNTKQLPFRHLHDLAAFCAEWDGLDLI